MKLVEHGISLDELRAIAERTPGNLVVADVDVARNVLAVDITSHSDGIAELRRSGSRPEDVWGVDLHPVRFGEDAFVDFAAIINIRPRQNNMTATVEDLSVQERIRAIMSEQVHE